VRAAAARRHGASPLRAPVSGEIRFAKPRAPALVPRGEAYRHAENAESAEGMIGAATPNEGLRRIVNGLRFLRASA
jgi:hypothetical protein